MLARHKDPALAAVFLAVSGYFASKCACPLVEGAQGKPGGMASLGFPGMPRRRHRLNP